MGARPKIQALPARAAICCLSDSLSSRVSRPSAMVAARPQVPAGACFFRRNIASRAALASMTARKRRGRGAADPTGSLTAQRRSTGRHPAPSLAELRKRAIARLRKLATALEAARLEYEDAEAECRRLKVPLASGPGALPAEPETASQAPAHEGATETGRQDTEALASPPEALTDALAEERARSQQFEAVARDLEQRLCEAEERLAAERSRADGLAARLCDAQDRLAALAREPSNPARSSSETDRARLAALERNLLRAQAANTRLRDEMAALLGFLDELSAILARAP